MEKGAELTEGIQAVLILALKNTFWFTVVFPSLENTLHSLTSISKRLRLTPTLALT